jgi:hypothetical protein
MARLLSGCWAVGWVCCQSGKVLVGVWAAVCGSGLLSRLLSGKVSVGAAVGLAVGLDWTGIKAAIGLGYCLCGLGLLVSRLVWVGLLFGLLSVLAAV